MYLLKTCLTVAILTKTIASSNGTSTWQLLRTYRPQFYDSLSGQSAADNKIIVSVSC
jgi:hypothetical protein